jgi:hypothetical protein
MPQDALPNGSAPDLAPVGSWSRVAGMQAKLHRWAAADPGRRFDDLFNFVHDPATLIVAFAWVAGNQGANTSGGDGVTAAWVEEEVGVPGFLDDLRAALKDGSFRPMPVRERTAPQADSTAARSAPVGRMGRPEYLRADASDVSFHLNGWCCLTDLGTRADGLTDHAYRFADPFSTRRSRRHCNARGFDTSAVRCLDHSSDTNAFRTAKRTHQSPKKFLTISPRQLLFL